MQSYRHDMQSTSDKGQTDRRRGSPDDSTDANLMGFSAMERNVIPEESETGAGSPVIHRNGPKGEATTGEESLLDMGYVG